MQSSAQSGSSPKKASESVQHISCPEICLNLSTFEGQVLNFSMPETASDARETACIKPMETSTLDFVIPVGANLSLRTNAGMCFGMYCHLCLPRAHIHEIKRLQEVGRLAHDEAVVRLWVQLLVELCGVVRRSAVLAREHLHHQVNMPTCI